MKKGQGPKAPAPAAPRPAAARAAEGLRIAVPAIVPAGPIVLDGAGEEEFWARAKGLPAPRLAGEPSAPTKSSTFSVLRAGRWLLLAMDAAEDVPVVARESMIDTSLGVEDVLVAELSAGGRAPLSVYVNPLGAMCCYSRGRRTAGPVTDGALLCGAKIGQAGWRAELAVDLGKLLDADDAGGEVHFRATRRRQQRGLIPLEASSTPAAGEPAAVLVVGNDWRKAKDVAVRITEAQRFAPRVTLQAGAVASVPTDEAGWAKMPAAALASEDGRTVVDADFQPTEVRAAATADSLSLRIRCREAYAQSIADAEGPLWGQDSLEVFLGPERFNYIQLVANSKGKATAARGITGGRRVTAAEPPRGVAIAADRAADGAWTVQVTIPFAAVARFVGAPADLTPPAWPWRVQIVRNRPHRAKLGQAAQVSILNVTRSSNSHCPARFAALRIVKPGAAPIPAPEPYRPELPPAVLDAAQMAALDPPVLLRRWVADRRGRMDKKHEADFQAADGLEKWKAHAARVRKAMMDSFFPATGGRMPDRGPLDARIVHDRRGTGFRCQGVIFQPIPGLPFPATLYLPDEKPGEAAKRPALIMIPAHHTGRNSHDLMVLGANFARAGGVALAVETVGSGERSVVPRWEHKNYQRCVINAQVALSGDTFIGQTAFEMSRAVDYLLARGDVDPARIAIVGGVAGGGDVSSLAAALDERISVSIPFNFSDPRPMPSWYDPLRSYWGASAGGYTPCMVLAVRVPARLLQASEFTWAGYHVTAYNRLHKLYDWFAAADNHAYLHGGPETHVTHFGPMHRAPMYKTLSRWFGMSLPAGQDREFVGVAGLSDLDCFDSAAGRQYLDDLRRQGSLLQPHQLAGKLAAQRLSAAGKARSPAALGKDLDAVLGDSSPASLGKITPRDLGAWRGHKVQGVWLPAEAGEKGLGVAAWVVLPKGKGRHPFVLGVAQPGKARFLADRADEVERLLAAGVGVCLADVRGCGETAPGPDRFAEGPLAQATYDLWLLKDNLPVHQLRDVRTTLAYLAGRADVDPARLGVWGEGLAGDNGPASREIRFDETGFRQASPEPKVQAEPLGGFLAMLAALYPVRAAGGSHAVKAVLVRGTLVSFTSVLDREHYYVPVDVIVPGLLRAADIPAIAECLTAAGVTLRAEDLRDGSNRLADAGLVTKAWPSAAAATYSTTPTPAAAGALIRTLKKP